MIAARSSYSIGNYRILPARDLLDVKFERTGLVLVKSQSQVPTKKLHIRKGK